MNSVEKAQETQLRNIQVRSGKTLEELGKILDDSGLSKHSELRDLLIRETGLGYGDASTFVHFWKKTGGKWVFENTGGLDKVLDGIYTGPKAALRPIHDRVMAEISKFGEFEVAPKKGYVSLRRRRQFAMVGPATKASVEIGINLKQPLDSPRPKVLPPGSMCNYTLRISDPAEVDGELVEWLRAAFEQAG